MLNIYVTERGLFKNFFKEISRPTALPLEKESEAAQ